MKQKNHKKKKTLKQQQSLSEHMNHSTRSAPGANTKERGPVQNSYWRRGSPASCWLVFLVDPNTSCGQGGLWTFNRVGRTG